MVPLEPYRVTLTLVIEQEVLASDYADAYERIEQVRELVSSRLPTGLKTRWMNEAVQREEVPGGQGGK